MSPVQQAELAAYKASLRPAHIADEIDRTQTELTRLAAAKTARIEQQQRPHLPNPTSIRHRAS